MANNINLRDKSIDEIKKEIIFYLKCFEETEIKRYKKQHLLHVEYWARVLQKTKQQNSRSFLFALNIF